MLILERFQLVTNDKLLISKIVPYLWNIHVPLTQSTFTTNYLLWVIYLYDFLSIQSGMYKQLSYMYSWDKHWIFSCLNEEIRLDLGLAKYMANWIIYSYFWASCIPKWCCELILVFFSV